MREVDTGLKVIGHMGGLYFQLPGRVAGRPDATHGERTMSKTALICGVSGQDGAYLARHLLQQGYQVFGTSRDAQMPHFGNLQLLGIREQVETLSMAPTDFRSVLQAVNKVEPDEIYNFAGQSSVGLSFEQPVETLESISVGTLNLLESIRFLGSSTRLYNAGSSECFGNAGAAPCNEDTPFRPRSPYAVAKAAAHWQVANYREAYGLFACSGILYNHESPLRPERFVTRKAVAAANRIAKGGNERLLMGDLDIQRDWGWAPEYVVAMWKMLQQEVPADFVVATGETHSLREFVQEAFNFFGLDWSDYVDSDPGLLRPSELMKGAANPQRAANKLHWTAATRMPEVVRKMCAVESGQLAVGEC
jgi:GDPmannose 4,6-dehydratase